MKRLFIGIPIQSGTARQLTQGWSMDRSININRIAWTRPENWHATFFFLSATAESQLTLLEQLIDEAFNDIEPITIQLNGLGVFPDKGKPRILWVGLENLEPLLPAYGALDDLLLKNGFLFDPKPLKPHLTLARIKSLTDRSPLDRLLNDYQLFNFGTVDVNRVTLFESHSSSSGVIYEPLYEKWLLKVYF